MFWLGNGGNSKGGGRRRGYFGFVRRVRHLTVGILRQSPLSSGVTWRKEGTIDERTCSMIFVNFKNLSQLFSA